MSDGRTHTTLASPPDHEHQTQVDCHRCDAIVTVHGAINDLPDPYTCLGCRPVKREPVPYGQFPPGF